MKQVIRVWDLPTRLFHWALALLVIGLLITGFKGGAAMDWHFRLGIGVLILVLFRVVWGLVGGHWSRFTSFVRGPASILAYLRGAPGSETPGHNPLGALSVLGMLTMLGIQVLSGLCSNDDIAFEGPLAKFIPNARVSQLTAYHKDVGAWIILALVVLHVAAIVFYRVKKGQNLVKPMLVGDREVEGSSVPASRDDAMTRVLALIVLAVAAGVGWWVWKL